MGDVRCIRQSSDGFLWFATGLGAIRYDGTRFLIFSNASIPVFKSGYSLCLAEFPAGSLWVGTGNGLLCLKNGKWTYFGKRSGLPGRTVIKLLADSKHRFWAGTDHGLAYMKKGEMRFHIFPRFQNLFIQGLIELHPGEIWVIAESRLYSIHKNHVSQIVVGSKTKKVWAIAADHRGGVWVSTDKGLFHSQNGQFDFVRLQPALSGKSLFPLLVTRDGTLWCGIEGVGVGRLVGARMQVFGEKDGLTQQKILSLFEDREGSLWVGTGSGVDRFRRTAFSSYGTADGLPYRVVQSVCEDDINFLWVATQKGVVRFGAEGDSKVFLKGKDVFSLLPLRNGRIWAGGRGLHALPVESADEKRLFLKFRKSTIFSMILARDKSRWIGTEHGLFRIFKGKIQVFKKVDGLPSERVRVIRSAPDGTLWIGTDGGVCHIIVGDSLRVIPLPGRLNDSFVYELFVEKNGTVWAGTDFGLRRIRNNTINALTVKNGLPSNDIYAIQPDGRGNFWISEGNGICSVSRTALDVAMSEENGKVFPALFDTRDGLPINSGLGGTQPVSWKDRSGEIWFATVNGLTVVNPRRIPRNKVAPFVQLEGVRVDGRQCPLHKKFSLQPGWKRLRVCYAGLSFVVPERNRYRIMLRGFDSGFSETSQTEVEYTNLDPGEYTFLVYAANNDGVWSQSPASFSFTVVTPWWRSLWFLGVVLVLAGILMNLLAKALLRFWSVIKQWRSTHVFGKYRIIEPVGRGGMGTVYRAISRKDDEIVALKVMDSDVKDEDARKRFLREGKLGQEMNHPNIVRIYDSGKAGGSLYYAMEFCQGIPLRSLMEEGMSIRAVLAVCTVLCDALHYLHKKGIVHRDVKPENVMILDTPDFQLIDEADDPVTFAGSCVKLLDLGLARQAGATTLTRTGLVAGTILYVPPESLGGSKHATSSVDYYAVGIMAYEMVTGVAPYIGEDMAELMYAVLYRSPTPPKEVEPRVPKPVSDFIMSLIEKDPSQRISGYDAIQQGFMKVLRGL
ncbi:MAG: protein kinase [Acidobacteria bacterium]|nr:protein kinase [Acidobacteriota bacterium]